MPPRMQYVCVYFIIHISIRYDPAQLHKKRIPPIYRLEVFDVRVRVLHSSDDHAVTRLSLRKHWKHFPVIYHLEVAMLPTTADGLG